MSDSHTPPPEKKNRRRAPVVAVAVLMATLMLSVAVVGPATQDAEAVVPIVVIGGALAIGAIAGWIANDLMNDGKDANAEAAKSANAATYKASILNEYQTAVAFAKSYADDKINNYEADSLLLTRRAEYLARELYLEQTAAGLPHNYDPYYVMAAPDMLAYIEAVIKGCSAQYEAAFKTMEGTAGNFYGDMSSLYYRVTYTGSSTITDFKPDNDNANLKYMHIPMLYTQDGKQAGSGLQTHAPKFYATDASENKMLFISKSSGDVSIALRYGTNNSVAHTYTLTDQSDGQMTWATLPEHLPDIGSYYFSSVDDDYCPIMVFGYAMKDVDSAVTPLSSMMLAYQQEGDKDILQMLLVNGAKDSTVSGDSVTYSRVRKTDGTYWGMWGHNAYAPVNFNIAKSVIFSGTEHLGMGEIYSTYNTILTTANVAANSYYNLLVASGDDQRYETMPDFLFPDPSQMEGLTVEEMYALLLVYRQQMADYYQNGAYMGLGNASFSPNSIGLYVRGALYNADGTPIYNDQAIWTPFVNVASQNLKVGDNVTFPHSMTVIKWGEAANIATFMETNGTTANMRWTYPGPGAYAIIEEMYKAGEPITEIDLTLSTYEVFAPDIPDPLPPGQSGLDNQTAGVNWLMENWYWVCVGIGAVTVIAAALLRNSAIAGVGLLIILAGLAGYAATEVLPEWWESVKPWVISQDFWRPGP